VTVIDLIVALFVALLVHEAGHTLAAWRCGVPVLAVRVGWPRVARWRGFEVGLIPMVGWVSADLDGTTPRQRLWLVVAGPLASFALAPLALLPGWLGLFGLVSLILGLANLLPVPPLDGGQMLLEVMEIAGVRVNRPLVTRCGMLAVLALHAPLLLPLHLWWVGVVGVLVGGATGLGLRRWRAA
jgi:membrane-associated protease RseP (regulator of RpoE activity)